ncbi:GrpE [Mitosporidium daphniae]
MNRAVFRQLSLSSPLLRLRAFRAPLYSTGRASGAHEPTAADASNTPASEPSTCTPKDDVKDSDKYKELHHSYLMVLADMENLRVRTRREVEAASNHSITRFAKDLLPVLDVLELALNNSKTSGSVSENEFAKALSDLREGVDLTRNELISVFRRHGIEAIEAEAGDSFDPNHHMAIFQAPKTEASVANRIVAVQKKGYRIKDRILRHTHVGVST